MKIEVLDHGYVEFVEAWGVGKDEQERKPPATDGSEYYPDYEVGIIEAARQSTQGSFRGWEPAACDCVSKEEAVSESTFELLHEDSCASMTNKGDARLLSYLYRNNHSTPFEFAGMVIEVQAPIFVFREWHRHRTQSYNEASARYAPLPELFYIPTHERVLMKGGTNKQAQGNGDLTEDNVDFFRRQLEDKCLSSASDYKEFLRCGVPKELARCVLPVNWYSKMRASANLRNWLAFMTLRCDPAAQWEIQQYANAVAKIIEDKFPQTYKLWKDGP